MERYNVLLAGNKKPTPALTKISDSNKRKRKNGLNKKGKNRQNCKQKSKNKKN